MTPDRARKCAIIHSHMAPALRNYIARAFLGVGALWGGVRLDDDPIRDAAGVVLAGSRLEVRSRRPPPDFRRLFHRRGVMKPNEQPDAPSAGSVARAGSTADVLKRLRRVEGQVRGVARMVEGERDYIDILQQLSAVQAALDKVALVLVEDHARPCLFEGGPESREEKRAELMIALAGLAGRH